MAYTDIEKRILDKWPKFEDGTYVMLVDKAIANSGENSGKEFAVKNIYFEGTHGKLRSSALDGCYWNWKAADPYVKRPAPKVLDAEGVEIKVGDTVWSDDGTEWLVEELNRYGARCFDGEKRWTFSPKFLSHAQPDSWKRLKDDATMSPWSYCDRYGLLVDRSDGEFAPTNETFALDLIRRAKALAEKEAAR